MTQPELDFTAQRTEAMETVAENAGKTFADAYYDYALNWIRNDERPFLAEWIRYDYCEQSEAQDLPLPHDWRSTGAITRKLVKEGYMRLHIKHK